MNATSLLGRHGPEREETGWFLVERGLASVVASDGHRLARPPFLDEAYELGGRRAGGALCGEAALPSSLDGRPSR